jgi:predicted Zn-dependent protease
MLDFVKSEDELAFVLGHELAHITEGHVTKGVVGGLALNVLAIVVESAAPGAGQLAGGIGQLFLNHYTQTQEREADSVGLRTAYGAGYDPRAAVEINQRMAVEAPQTMTAGYFDTHPSSPERAVAARKLSEQLLAQGPPPGREQVLAMEERGEDRFSARDASYEDEPAVRDDAAADYAVSSYRHEEAGPRRDEPADGAASSEECRRAETYTGMARDARDLADRESYLRRALRVCPGLVSAHVDLGRVLRERGDAAGAEREFRRALEIDPGDREARRELGR